MRVYVVEPITGGGVPEGPEVYGTAKAARRRMYQLAREWGRIMDSAGQSLTPTTAARNGYFATGDGESECIMWECTIQREAVPC